MDNAVHVQQQESVLAGGDEAPWQAVRIQELAALATEHVGLLLPGVEAFVAVVPPHRRPRAIVAAATQGWRERLLGRAFELPPDHVERPQETLERAHRLLPAAAVAHAVPLASGLPPGDGRSALGLMVFFRLEARFTQAEVRLMEELARRLSTAMQRSELVSVEVAADRLQAATDAALDLGGSLEPAKVVERMLRRAADEADADVAGLLRREEDDLLWNSGYDRDGEKGETAFRIGLASDWPSQRALELGEPVLRSPEPLATRPEVGSWLKGLEHSARVPLLLEGEPAALLLLGRRRGRPFTRDDVALLEVLARHAAVAIRNARLYERAQSAARRLQVGVDMALDAATRLEPEEAVERILNRALDAVEADRATLGHLEEDFSCTVIGSVARRGEPARVGTTFPVEKQQTALEAVRTRRPAQGPLHHAGEGQRAGWTLVLPLILGGDLVALLAVSGDRRPFNEDEVALLQQIGSVAALALRNATLFETLREGNRVRSQFLNMAAHELRTPLSVIAGYVSMLADGTLGEPPPTWEAPLAVLVAKTRELAHLIDDILLAGRLESGLARTSSRVLDVRDAVTDAVLRARARAELMDAELRVDLPPAPLPASCDPDHIARILDNLLNNAFNYSPRPARVRLLVGREDGWAVVRVEDRGRGIPAEQRERIFQQFYRVDDPSSGYPPGTGLGLFISRGLAERHGGRLELEWSEVGAGSRFALRLPLAEDL